MSRADLTNALDHAVETVLQDELRFFREHESEWAAQHAGCYVLIGKGTFAGFYSAYGEAMRAGIRAFGPIAPFLVRRVGSKE